MTKIFGDKPNQFFIILVRGWLGAVPQNGVISSGEQIFQLAWIMFSQYVFIGKMTD